MRTIDTTLNGISVQAEAAFTYGIATHFHHFSAYDESGEKLDDLSTCPDLQDEILDRVNAEEI